MTKRILVPVNRTACMEPVLSVVRGIARHSNGTVRLVAIIAIPEPLLDRANRVIVSTDRQMERLEQRTADELRALAVAALDGVPVEARVRFGDAAVEIGIEAECFGADLVVVTEEPRRDLRSLLARIAPRAIVPAPFHARVLHMPA
jgi:nucleotide-binding universal stress UspA family protein